MISLLVLLVLIGGRFLGWRYISWLVEHFSEDGSLDRWLVEFFVDGRLLGRWWRPTAGITELWQESITTNLAFVIRGFGVV